MESELMLGKYALPFVFSYLLSFIFKMIAPNGDVTLIGNKVKQAVAVFGGIAMGFVALFYAINLPNSEVILNTISLVDYGLSGFMMGLAAIGANQLQKMNGGGISTSSPVGISEPKASSSSGVMAK